MDSRERYYQRRAAEELAAARRAVTPEARKRRQDLAQSYLDRLTETGGDRRPQERTCSEWPLPTRVLSDA